LEDSFIAQEEKAVTKGRMKLCQSFIFNVIG